MVVTQDLLLLVPVGAAQVTTFLARSSRAGAIQGQSDEATVVEGFVALGLTDGGDHGSSRDGGGESLREVGERVIAEALANVQGAAGP